MASGFTTSSDSNQTAATGNSTGFFDRQYEEEGSCGEGAYGQVKKVTHKVDQGKYAMKSVPIHYGKNVRLEKICPALNISIEGVQLNSDPSGDEDEMTREELRLLEKCQSVVQEARLMAKLSHKNVVRYNTSFLERVSRERFSSGYGTGSSSEDDSETNSSGRLEGKEEEQQKERNECCLVFYIQMEKLDTSLASFTLGNLELAVPFNPDIYIQLFGEIVEGVHYLHHMGVLHRDLKPDNILLTRAEHKKYHVKIGDFGAAKLTEMCDSTLRPENTPEVGTSFYTSPEQLRGDVYGPQSDMYSLGVILAEMWTQFITFREKAEYFPGLREEKTDFLKVLEPKEVGELVCDLTRSEPDRRPSAQQCLERISQIEDVLGGRAGSRQAETSPRQGHTDSRQPPMSAVDGLQLERLDLNQSTDQLTQVAASLEREKEKLKKQNVTLRREKEKLRQRHNALESEIDQLKQYYASLSDEKDMSKLGYSSLIDENEQLKQQNAALKNENDKLKRENRWRRLKEKREVSATLVSGQPVADEYHVEVKENPDKKPVRRPKPSPPTGSEG